MLKLKKSCSLAALAVALLLPTFAQAESKAFLIKFCTQCHGDKKPKANLPLHNLTEVPVKRVEIDTWKHVLDKIEAEEMPPAGAKQPTANERQQMIAAIKGMLKNAGVSLDETRLLAPARGNWIDHDALFSGKAVDPAATKPRLWRLSGQAYEEFMRQKIAQFKLGIKAYGLGKIRAPWEERGQKEFSDYASAHKIGEADLEYLLRNASKIAKAMVVKFGGKRPSSAFSDFIGELNIVILAGKSATAKQIEEAVIASFDKILNRKLMPDELNRYAGFFKKNIDQLGGERGAEQFLTAILLRPEVMYRLELPATDDKRGILPPRALARAISLALTDSEPDALLVKAANTGKLASPADVRSHVERILRDRNIAKTRVLRFFQEYFGYTGAMDVFKDETTIAEYGIGKNGWSPSFFVADTDHLIQWLLAADKNVLHELLTTPKTFLLTAELRGGKKVQPGAFKSPNVRGTLAIYEIDITGDRWSPSKPFDMPAEHRMGILTHPSWLAAHSTNFDNHAIDRGRWVRERLLGGRIPEIPVTVDATLPDEPHKPLRERMRVTKVEYCWQCHKHMDPLGLTFEQYDHFGRYRTAELVVDKVATEQKGKKGKLGTRVMTTAPLDTTGMVEGSGDAKLDGPVKGPRDLIAKLAKSERVEQVFVRHVFRYFLGRNETLSDGPILVAAHRAYKEGGGSMNALLTSLMTSDSFLYRAQVK
jgi:hypothetical protein